MDGWIHRWMNGWRGMDRKREKERVGRGEEEKDGLRGLREGDRLQLQVMSLSFAVLQLHG